MSKGSISKKEIATPEKGVRIEKEEEEERSTKPRKPAVSAEEVR
jgi:hypothetical protein